MFMRLVVVGLLTAVWTFPRLAAAQAPSCISKTPAVNDAIHVTLHPSACPSGRVWTAETANFRIQWQTSDTELRALAETCERMLARSKAAWLGTEQASPWLPQCEIVVHRDLSEYVASVGPGGQQTSGCATIRIDQARVVVRRVDLCADALDWRTESLPHELTHVVLADRFTTRRIAPWADEGIAMLSESPEKRTRRLTALRRAAATGATYTVRGLMGVQTCPEPAMRTAFYGQSVALVSLLLEWGTRKQLLEFAEASQSQGPDAALAAVYGNRPVTELEQQLAGSLSTDRFMHLAGQSATPAALQLRAGGAALK
jgi:hypothetical protein